MSTIDALQYLPQRYLSPLMIVECASVHQHFNDDPDNEAVLLVFKAKPLFLFMHLLFQKIVSYPPNEASPGHEDFRPPKDL